MKSLLWGFRMFIRGLTLGPTVWFAKRVVAALYSVYDCNYNWVDMCRTAAVASI